MYPTMQLITQFGDQAVLLPQALLLSLALWRGESKRAAIAFACAFSACVFLIFILKLFFISCGYQWNLDITSPSGHTSISTMVYGAFAIVASVHLKKRRVRWLVVLALGALPLAIAVSRVVLHAHTLSEVIVGLVFGIACTVLFARPYLKLPHPEIRMGALALLALLIVGATYGLHAPAESMLRLWSDRLTDATHICADNKNAD